MKRQMLLITCTVFLLALPSVHGDPGEFDEEQVLQKIHASSRIYYGKYSGFQTLREALIKEYDPATNSLVATKRIRMRRKDFFQKRPEVQVLAVTIDGKNVGSSQFNPRRPLPFYPPF